jgi:uncharacterized protein YjbI with pentapeptide repeats
MTTPSSRAFPVSRLLVTDAEPESKDWFGRSVSRPQSPAVARCLAGLVVVDASLVGHDFSATEFRDCVFARTSFVNCDLTNAMFAEGCALIEVSLTRCRIAGLRHQDRLYGVAYDAASCVVTRRSPCPAEDGAAASPPVARRPEWRLLPHHASQLEGDADERLCS